MAYIIQPATILYYCDDSVVADYLAAGWTQANATQLAAWKLGDPYGGLQSAPPAPPLLNPVAGTAPPPITEDN